MLPEELEYIDHIGRLVKDADLAISREVNGHMRDKSITSTQAWILGNLYHEPDGTLPLKEIEGRMRTSQSSAWGVVSRMEKAGLVETEVHPADGRARLVRITEEGRARSEACLQTMRDTEQAIAELMSAEERAELQELLRRIVARFDDAGRP